MYEDLPLQMTFPGLRPPVEHWGLSALWGSWGLQRTEGHFYSPLPSKGLPAAWTAGCIKK